MVSDGWEKTDRLRSKQRAASFYLSPRPPFIATRRRFVGRFERPSSSVSKCGGKLAALLSSPAILGRQSLGPVFGTVLNVLDRPQKFRSCRLGRCATRRAARKRGARCDPARDRKSTRLNSSHSQISYAVFCLKKRQ